MPGVKIVLHANCCSLSTAIKLVTLSRFFSGIVKTVINFELRKEGNVLFNDALNTFYLRLFGVTHGKGPLR